MSTTPESPPPRFARAADGRVLAGVGQGLAVHLGVDVLVVRVALVLLALAGGAGVLMYAALWVLAPLDAGAGARTTSRELGYLVALGGTAVIAFALVQLLLGVSGQYAWPLLVAGLGVVLLWRQADDSQRRRVRAATGATRRSGVARAILGLLLVVAGSGLLLVGDRGIADAGEVLLAAGVLVVGLALISGPWWMRMARELSAERAARIREQERAEVAAHVHDSVLHTLTLIQRHVEDPREVARLARAQERELRGWLYRPVDDRAGATLRTALERAVAETEDEHGVTVELVVVGDCPVDAPLVALLSAAREALVNAAKYAGTDPISVFAEVEPGQVTVFVRDRGPGFDLAAVPVDRLGVRQSVVGRMSRNGGRALVRSTGGEGTEIRLEMPRPGAGAVGGPAAGPPPPGGAPAGGATSAPPLPSTPATAPAPPAMPPMPPMPRRSA